MTIRHEAPETFWDDVISKSSCATYFHTRQWADLICNSFPHIECASQGYILNDGTRAILPLVKQSFKKKKNKYSSIEPGVYGGLLTDGRQVTEQECREIFSELKNVDVCESYVFGNPFCELCMPSQFERRKMFTQVIRLNESFDRIWANYKSSVRKQVRKAHKRCLQIRVADRLKDYKKYFQLYQEALERWGDKVHCQYPFAIFKNIYLLADPRIKLWLCTHDSEIKGGIITFYCNGHVVTWHSAFDHLCFPHGISNYMFNELILHAAENGYRVFDFNPSAGIEGVVRFKQNFGTERLYFDMFCWPQRAIGKIKSKVKKVLFKT